MPLRMLHAFYLAFSSSNCFLCVSFTFAVPCNSAVGCSMCVKVKSTNTAYYKRNCHKFDYLWLICVVVDSLCTLISICFVSIWLFRQNISCKQKIWPKNSRKSKEIFFCHTKTKAWELRENHQIWNNNNNNIKRYKC